MTDHVATKHLLRERVTDSEEFQQMLLRAMLSKDEAELMWRHYKEKQDLRLIADSMGISYTTAKQWHKRSLKILKGIL